MNLYVFVLSAFRKALKINSGTSGYLVRADRSDSYIFLDVKEVKYFKILKLHNFAEAEGFEPSDPKRSTVFKTAAIDRSAKLPYVGVR